MHNSRELGNVALQFFIPLESRCVWVATDLWLEVEGGGENDIEGALSRVWKCDYILQNLLIRCHH